MILADTAAKPTPHENGREKIAARRCSRVALGGRRVLMATVTNRAIEKGNTI